MKIQSLIVDDEENSRAILKELLSEFCPEIEIIGEADSVKSGVRSIKELKPKLVFLDINMTDGYGFEVFKHEYPEEFEVIFVTAYSEFATKAFDYAALHYLLKPIDVDDLLDGIERFKNKHLSSNEKQLNVLDDALSKKLDRIVIHSVDGFEVYPVDQIIYFSSQDGYSYLHLNTGKHRLIGSSLNHYEEVLSSAGFCRVHAKYLINLNHVVRFKGSRGGKVTLSNQDVVEVSVRKKDDFVKRLGNMTL